MVAIGETGGATYPFTGEGISKAMEAASLAANQTHLALEQGNVDPLRELPSMVDERLSPRYLGYHCCTTLALEALVEQRRCGADSHKHKPAECGSGNTQ